MGFCTTKFPLLWRGGTRSVTGWFPKSNLFTYQSLSIPTTPALRRHPSPEGNGVVAAKLFIIPNSPPRRGAPQGGVVGLDKNYNINSLIIFSKLFA
jgi:hypothetical protein